MKELQIKNFTYRVKKINAIQMLALRSQIDYDDFEKVEKFYGLILSQFEVNCNGQWLPVREEQKNGSIDYFPAGIEEDIETIEQLLHFFMDEVMRPFFTKSNASN